MCRMVYLRRQLDDAGALDCGRCDNCGGLKLPGGVDDHSVTEASAALGRPGVTFDPRRMWPAAMPGLGIDVRGKVPAEEQAEPGRVVARFTDLGFGSRVRAVLATDQDLPDVLPDDLARACVEVLAAWDWAQRPAAVVHVGSTRRPLLGAAIATRIADIGRLPHLGAVAHRGHTSSGRSNSAFRLREVWDAFEVSEDLAAKLHGQPTLLVDDFVDTGWTLTVVARLLRRAGAGRVYPFALAMTG
jgi:ATP-dependent DNA helicase RecQ